MYNYLETKTEANHVYATIKTGDAVRKEMLGAYFGIGSPLKLCLHVSLRIL